MRVHGRLLRPWYGAVTIVDGGRAFEARHGGHRRKMMVGVDQVRGPRHVVKARHHTHAAWPEQFGDTADAGAENNDLVAALGHFPGDLDCDHFRSVEADQLPLGHQESHDGPDGWRVGAATTRPALAASLR